MFSSINFLFLLSLGFISWVILCYIQQIEQIHPITKKQAMGKIIKYLKDAIPPYVSVKKDSILGGISNAHKETPQLIDNQTITRNDRYDLYVNFLGIFVCIYALAKITHLAEMYMARHIRHKIYAPTIVPDNNLYLPNVPLNDLHEQQENLKWKLNLLEQQNQAMKFKLNEVALSTTPSGHRMHADLEENLRSIIITNKHIHLTGQIYVNQDDAQRKSNVDSKEMKKECDNNVDVWNKYLQLQKKSAPENQITPAADVDASMPVVMSSQDLENIKGII